jgi:hypothetical protein
MPDECPGLEEARMNDDAATPQLTVAVSPHTDG